MTSCLLTLKSAIIPPITEPRSAVIARNGPGSIIISKIIADITPITAA